MVLHNGNKGSKKCSSIKRAIVIALPFCFLAVYFGFLLFGLGLHQQNELYRTPAKVLRDRDTAKRREAHARVLEVQLLLKQDVENFLNETVTQMRETVRSSRGPFTNKTVITIRGFYSSGTNWLRSLIIANCPDLPWRTHLRHPYPRFSYLDADGLYGWKHGYFLEKEIAFFQEAERHRMIIVSREAPTWVVSAWKMNAMVPTPSWFKPPRPPPTVRRAKTLMQFPNSVTSTGAQSGNKLSTPLFNVTQPPRFSNLSEYIQSFPVNETGVPGGVFHGKYYDPEIRSRYILVAENPLKARTKVYENWISLLKRKDIADRIRFIRYEDLKERPYEMMKRLDEEFDLTSGSCNLTSSKTFNPVSTRVKMGVRDGAKLPQQSHHRKEFCEYVKDESLYRAILARVDRDFEERSLGYSYPETLAEYCKDALELRPVHY